jgi:uncharacterized delta-60 repeat protein
VRHDGDVKDRRGGNRELRSSLASVALLSSALLAAVLTPTLAQAARPGDLDPSFSGDGKVRTQLCSPGGFSVAVDDRSRAVVAGANGGGSFCLARYKPDGHLDRSFGDDGKVITFSGDSPGAGEVAIDPNGRIVAEGSRCNGNLLQDCDLRLARYKPNGTLDPGFSGDGELSTTFAGTTTSIAIDSHGRIVVAGYRCSADFHNCDFTLARYKWNGTLDTSFGVGGKVTTDFGRRDMGEAVAIESGRIIVAGETCSPSFRGCDFALARYRRNGLDPSFGAGGKVTTTFRSSIDRALSVAIDPQGRVVAAGYTVRNDRAVFALARYKPGGAHDQSFSNNGKVITRFGHSAAAWSVSIDSRSQIVAAGDDGFNLARYRPNGALDRSFSGNGKATAGFGAFAGSAAVDSKDRIVASGEHGKVVLARFIGYRSR